MLQVKGPHIVDDTGNPVRLRGVCVGGWLNMEPFITGHPGAEHMLRHVMREELGPAKADFFFERLAAHFFTADDVAFIQQSGANVIRLPLNYRHFEDDQAPFRYDEAAFAKLDQMVAWCQAAGIYLILDMHAAQGWQNDGWHSDNASGRALLWQHPHFQDRFVALWEALVRHYVGNATIAGYNVLNEPMTGARYGSLPRPYHTDWAAINALYSRAVATIRAIDPDHIIFLEGDLASQRFAGLDAPFAANLVYSCHAYPDPTMLPGPYDVSTGAEQQRQTIVTSEGYQFAQTHGVPLWMGECGAFMAGPAGDASHRIAALGDQLRAAESLGLHWTTWTYKDVGVMGWRQLPSDAAYLLITQPIQDAKRAQHADSWFALPPTATTDALHALDRVLLAANPDPAIDAWAHHVQLGFLTLDGFASATLQHAYAHCFASLTETEIDETMASFALATTQPQPEYHAMLIDLFHQT